MCNVEFMNKEPKKTYDFLEQLTKSFQAQDSYEPKENSLKGKERTSCIGERKYTLNEEHDLSARLVSLAKKVEAIEVRKTQEVKNTSNSSEVTFALFDSNTHITHHYLTILGLKEALNEPINTMVAFKKADQNSPFLET